MDHILKTWASVILRTNHIQPSLASTYFYPTLGMLSMTRQALDLTMHQRATKLGATSVNAGKCESRMSSIAGNLSCPFCPRLGREGHSRNLSQLPKSKSTSCTTSLSLLFPSRPAVNVGRSSILCPSVV